MLTVFLAAAVLLCSFNLIAAECPNACSAHGRCGAYDMCICYRNWMANDCSERICQFGLAHVDTPLGDLDASGNALTGPDTTVVVNDAMYPFGTQEQFPAMVDSDGTVLPNSAHYYRECSNKGICDRGTGECQCFDGYGGSACQRATCPSTSAGVCSGHGTCETISTIADWDSANIYNLWDEDSTMGCVCDGGYTGADCSQRICKAGPDPLYYDDVANIRISNYTFQFYHTGGSTKKIIGNYSIVFYDSFGEDWQTAPIDIDAGCPTIIAALEGLPNNVIPLNSVLCFRADATNTPTSPYVYADNEISTSISAAIIIQTRYTVAFRQNFGRLRQPDINIYLDGTRPTLYTDESGSTLGYHVYPNGFIGENDDLVPDLCEGVLVTVAAGANYDTLSPEDAQQMKALKRCLGSADANGVSNVADVYDWDHGTVENPHLVKLIEATQESLSPGSPAPGAPNNAYPDALRDPSLYDYPISRLCDRTGFYLEKQDRLNTNMREPAANGYMDGTGWCQNVNPAGFYAVIYWVSGASFRVLTRPSADYSATTKFHIFTTKGYLQLVNPNSGVFTHTFTRDSNKDKFMSASHSPVLHLANNTATAGFFGQVDCETNPLGAGGVGVAGTFGALDCINKNDYVMVFNNDVATANGHAANPVYPNIYKVNKIFRAHKTANDYGTVQNEVARQQIILDYGMNVRYTQSDTVTASALVVEALIFKFHPAASYNYVAECSNRGICDSASGICQCFAGYTGDNCGIQNALAK